MPTTLIQERHHAQGEAVLRVQRRDLAKGGDPADLQIAIVQAGDAGHYLDPASAAVPWSAGVGYFRPDLVTGGGQVWQLTIGPAVTAALESNMPYRLLIRLASGEVFEEVFVGAGNLRRPGATRPPIPTGDPALATAAVPVMTVREALPEIEPVVTIAPLEPAEPAEPVAAPAEAPALAAPVAVEAPPATTTSAPRSPPPEPEATKPRRPAALMIGLVALILLLAGVFYGYLRHQAASPVPVAEPPVKPTPTEPTPSPAPSSAPAPAAIPAKPGLVIPTTESEVRTLLQSDPPADQARTIADALLKADALPDGRFLLYRYAAQRGDGAAARTVGEYYDATHRERLRSPLDASPERAAEWYQLGAEAGDVEAAYRFGLLVKEGFGGKAGDAAEARPWFERAAKGGHAEAAKALGR